MSVRLPGIVAVAAAFALVMAACGGDSARPPGAPAPPDAAATTDCAELGSGGGDKPDPAARGPLPYGFNDHAGLVGAIPVAEDADLHEHAGSTLWRVAIDWRFAEPEPGAISLATHDAIYCEGLARGIAPIFHITGAPEWAARPGPCPVESCIDPPRPSALGALTDFAELVAARYPRTAAIEAWNEPNLATFWSEPDPARYVDVLAAIREGVKRADPSLPVLGGSLSNTGRSDATRTGYGEFLHGMYDAGAAEEMDALAFHPYPLEPLGSRGERFTGSMDALRRIMRQEGDGERPLWITEVGLSVGDGIGEADQARTMRGIYARLSRDPRVRAVVFHTLVDTAEAAGAGAGFGWLVADGDGGLRPRAVFGEFAG